MCINTFCGLGDRKRLCVNSFRGVGSRKRLCVNVFRGVGRGNFADAGFFLVLVGRIVASANGFLGVGRRKDLCVNRFRGVGRGNFADAGFFLAVRRTPLADAGHYLGLGGGKGLLCNDLRRFGGREDAGGVHRRGGGRCRGGHACGNIGLGGGNGRGSRCGGGGSGGGVGKEVEHHAFEVGEARLLQGRGGGQRERTHVGCAHADGRSGACGGSGAHADGIRARAWERSGTCDGLRCGGARGGNDNGGRATHADGQGARGGAMVEEVTGHAEGVVQPIARRGLPRNHGPTVVAAPMAFGVVGHEPFGVELGVVQRFGEVAHLVGRGGHEQLARSLLATACFVAFLARGQGIRL